MRMFPGVPLVFTVKRDGQTVNLTATPDVVDLEGRFGHQRFGQLGISRTGLDREW